MQRRDFIAALGAAAIFPGMRSRSAAAQLKTMQLQELPSFQGQFLVDDVTRQSVATDWGHHFRKVPLAVVRPKTAQDVAQAVAYAGKEGIKVAMRGQGHSLSGQSQVQDGIIIDARTLNAVHLRDDTIDAQPGASWGQVAQAALARGMTPPVLVDAMMLTVGGTLSVGGSGAMGYRFGAQVDNVVELDVVTGTGEILTCSPEVNSELFRMTLAGLGQCGLIVRARLRLMRAPSFVVNRTLAYEDLDAFLEDQSHLIHAADVNLLNGSVSKEPDRAKFSLLAGSYVASAAEAERPAAWMAGLRHSAAEKSTIMTYWEYLDRRTALLARAIESHAPNPAIVATLPDASVRSFLNYMLSNPDAYAGIWMFEVSPKVTARHTQPLQKMPSGSLSYELRMQRRASADNAPDHKAMLAMNEAVLPRIQDAGGKIYPPFAPIPTREQWRTHYGATWMRFAAAKRQFDPKNVLTPGFAIF
jgi:cytokinin dehydrogenase